jgi:hypothetical protein
MGFGKDANDAVDLGVASGHPRNESRQYHETVAQPETTGVGKVAQSGLYRECLGAELVPQGLEWHARVTRVLAVVRSQECQRAGADLLDCGRRDPKVSQESGAGLPASNFGGRARGETKQDGKRG